MQRVNRAEVWRAQQYHPAHLFSTLKIDVEGMDYQVLLGGAETIERFRPFLYMEAKKSAQTAAAIQWLQSRDFNVFWHFAAFYSKENYRDNPENVFGGRGDINLIALPRESEIRPSLPQIESPESDWQANYRQFLQAEHRE